MRRLLLLTITLFVHVLSGLAQEIKEVRVTESTLRRYATHIVVPVLQSHSSVPRAKSVVVAAVSVNPEGRVSSVMVLESPSEAINERVVRALKQWEFYPFRLRDEPLIVHSVITLYMQRRGRRVMVAHPKYFERAPTKARQSTN